MNDLDFFIRESVQHAKSLPINSSVSFLGGLLNLGKERKELSEVRRIFNSLRDCDHQLELIASGQLKLSLQPATATKKGSRK